MSRSLRITLVAIALVIVGGCGSGTASTTATESTSSTASPSTAAPVSTEAPPATTAEAESTTTAAEAAGPVWFGDYLSVGDCWTDIRDENDDYVRTGEPQILDCSEVHEYQVTGIVESDAEAYPGSDALFEETKDACSEAHADFTGTAIGEGNLEGFILRPTEEDWEAGARQVLCIAYFRFVPTDMSFEDANGSAGPPGYPPDPPIPAGAEMFDAGENEEGDMVVGFNLDMAVDAAIDSILAKVNDSGWSVTNRFSLSETVVFELTDGTDDYTLTVTEDAEEGGVTLALFYDPPS